MELTEDRIGNFLDLPLEIQCIILRSYALSLRDIQRISLVSKGLMNNLRTCLTYLHTQPLQVISTWEGEEFLEGGKDFYLAPDFLHLFPNLKETDYPVKITSLQDLRRVAGHPRIRKAILDLQPFYNNLYRVFRDEEIATRDEDWQFSGLQITAMRKTGPVTLTISNISEAILFFLHEYRYFHPQTRLLGTNFTFLIPELDINYQPASLCFKPVISPTVLNPLLWQPKQIFTGIARIDQIRKYAGPWPVPKVNTLEEVVIYIDVDKPSSLLQGTVNGPRFGNEKIAKFLLRETNLRHLGFHPIGSSHLMTEIFQDFDLLRFLRDLGVNFPGVKVYDFPVLTNELLLLHQVFPDVKEPLLEPFYALSNNDRRYLQDSQRYFTTFRLLPDFNYPKDLINNYPTRIDPDNTFTKYPC